MDPKIKFLTFLVLKKKTKNKININNNIGINSFLNKKKISEIKNAQKKALILSFKKKNIPFREFKINIISEESLGKLFSYFIIETIILGRLLNVDPFNQPAVEQVKIYTKKFLT